MDALSTSIYKNKKWWILFICYQVLFLLGWIYEKWFLVVPLLFPFIGILMIYGFMSPILVVVMATFLNFSLLNIFRVPLVHIFMVFSIFLLFIHLMYRRIKLKFEKIDLVFLFMSLLILFTLSRWHRFPRGIMGTLTMLVIPWTIILIFRISAEIKILRRIYYTFTFLALILIIEVLFIFVTKALGKEFFDYHGFSIGWAYSNYLAAIANLLFPLSYMLCFVERRWRILNIIVTTGLMFCILLTISRGGIIILFISLSLILLFQTIYWKRFYYVWIYLLFLTGIILFLNYTHIGERTIARLNTISPNEPAIAGRFVMWRESVSCIKASPLIGFGPNQKEVLGTTNPHNYFLKIGFELGILGIIVFIWLLNILLHKALSIKKLLKNKREAQFLSIAFLTTIIIAIVNSLFEPTFSGYHYNPLFWFIMGILYLTYETSRTKETVIF